MSNTVPSGWRLLTIADFAKTSAGGTPNTQVPEYWENGSIPWMSSGEVHKKRVKSVNQSITELGFQNSSAKLFPVGTILIALAGQGKTRGTVAISEIELTTNQSIAGVIVKDRAIHPDYVYQNLDSRYEELRAVSGGSGRAGLNLAIIGEQQLMLPPLPEQQKIAAILSSVDNVIEKTRAQIDKLKDLKTGMMQELLSKGIGSGGVPHTEFKDTVVGQVPASWEVASISEIQSKEKYSCVGGPFGSDLTSKHYVEKAGVPVIRGSNLPLDFRRFIDDGFVYVSEEKAKTLTKNMAYPGDLVFTQRGTLGQVGLIPVSAKFSQYVISQSQMKLNVDESKANKVYLYQFFLSGNFLRALDQQTIATGLPHINLGILKSFLIPLPPIPEQTAIANILNSVDQKTATLQTKLETYIALKKALMQDLLTGKVRVNVGENETAVA